MITHYKTVQQVQENDPSPNGDQVVAIRQVLKVTRNGSINMGGYSVAYFITPIPGSKTVFATVTGKYLRGSQIDECSADRIITVEPISEDERNLRHDIATRVRQESANKGENLIHVNFWSSNYT